MVYRTVNVEALVTYCQNGYSVPWRYIGSMCSMRITEKELIVYGPQVEEIARHGESAGECHGATGHARSTARRGIRNNSRRGETVRPVGGAGPCPSWRVCSRFSVTVTTRPKRYGEFGDLLTGRSLITALGRAVRYWRVFHAAVERILSAQARPRTMLETLTGRERRQIPPWLGEDLVSPRPTSGSPILRAGAQRC